MLGRPPSISDSYADAQYVINQYVKIILTRRLPSNLELSEFNTSLDPNASAYRSCVGLELTLVDVPQPRPLSEPTTATFLILRSQLAKIVGRIVHHFQKLDEPAQYSDVERLQRELETFSEQLPPHFRMHRPDKSLDKSESMRSRQDFHRLKEALFWLPVHRFMLLTEILVTTIILHVSDTDVRRISLMSQRPWLLRKLSSNRYAASRTSCFEAAKLDFRIRQEFSREVPDFRLFAITGQFKMFNSAMIAGISAIIDPRGPDSEQMRKILTTFLEENPWHEVASKDETTKKEVQIVCVRHQGFTALRCSRPDSHAFEASCADIRRLAWTERTQSARKGLCFALASSTPVGRCLCVRRTWGSSTHDWHEQRVDESSKSSWSRSTYERRQRRSSISCQLDWSRG